MKQDPKQAAEWYRKCAEQGHAAHAHSQRPQQQPQRLGIETKRVLKKDVTSTRQRFKGKFEIKTGKSSTDGQSILLVSYVGADRFYQSQASPMELVLPLNKGYPHQVSPARYPSLFLPAIVICTSRIAPKIHTLYIMPNTKAPTVDTKTI